MLLTKETESPAIIKIKVGKGICILTGVHLEYPANELAPCELKPGVKEELLMFEKNAPFFSRKDFRRTRNLKNEIFIVNHSFSQFQLLS